MGNLSNLYVSRSFQSLIHLGTDGTASAALTTLQDGYGNSIGIEVNTAGNLYLSGSLTASLQEGYILVGNGSGKTSAFSTSSLVTNINTGSLVTTASFNSYTASTNSSITQLNASSASQQISINALNTNSASVNTSITNLNTTTASLNSSITQLNASSESQQISIDSLNSYTASQSTASIVTSITNLNTFSASALVSISNLNTFSSSALVSISNLNTTTASLNSSITQLNASSASQQISINALNSYTASNQPINTGSFAITGSNTFNGTQNVSGSIVINSADSDQLFRIYRNGQPTQNWEFGITALGNSFLKTRNRTWVQNDGGDGEKMIHLLPTRFVDGIYAQDGPLNITGSVLVSNGDLRVTGALTASLQQGYVWVGNASGVSSLVATSSFAGGALPSGVISGSAQITALGFVSSSVTASSLVTASFSGNTLTFTKGDGNTFGIVIPDVSGSGDISALNAFTASQLTINSGYNAYTASNDQRVSSLEANSASVNISITNVNSATASLFTSVNNINSATASLYTSASLGLVTASFSGNTLTFTKGDSSTFGVVIPDVSGSGVPAGTVSSSAQILAYNIFATTGSNTFIGNQYISGALKVASDGLSIQGNLAGSGSQYPNAQLVIDGDPANIYATYQGVDSNNNGIFGIGINSYNGKDGGAATFWIGGGQSIGGDNTILTASPSNTNLQFWKPNTIFNSNVSVTGSLTVGGSPVVVSSQTGSFITESETGSFATTGSNTFTGIQNFTQEITSSAPVQFNGRLNINGGINQYFNVYTANGVDPNINLFGNPQFSGSQYPNFNIKVSTTQTPTDIYGGYNINDSNGNTFISLLANSYSPEYGGTVTPMITANGNNPNGSITAIAFTSNGEANHWKKSNFKYGVDVTGSITIQSGSGDLYVHGHKQFNVGAFQSNVSQSGSANVSQSMNFEVTDISQGVSIASNSRITLANAGVYNIQFSAQLLADTGADDVYIWLKKNGTNVTASAGRVTLANNEELIAAWNYVVDAAANDYFELVWQSSNGDAIILAETATGNIPLIPSIILTVTQVR